ncbi:hypothetical protein [Pedobacter sp.]|uniref:hypothetical protein n=1 Tax=Pedobacter sp. TaxID=1411316 RepID=UPI0031D30432
MKKKLLCLATILVLLNMAKAQKPTEGAVKMTADYGPANEEARVIVDFQGVEYYKVKLMGTQLKATKVLLYCKEMWNGKVKKVDTLIKKLDFKNLTNAKGDTLSFSVLGRRVDDKLQVLFRFPRLGVNKKYQSLKTDNYSLRVLGNHYKIELNKSFPVFAYILPYEKDGWLMYCAVDQSGENVEDWGKKFGIKHYLIYEMAFLRE